MKTITITISKGGAKRIEAHGFVGGECHTATAPFEKGRKTDGDNKPEYYQSAEEQNQQQVGQ